MGPEQSWALDSTEVRPGASAGSSSLRFNCTQAASNFSGRLLSAPIAAEPNRTYQLSAFAKLGGHGGDRPWVWLVQLDSQGREIRHLPTGEILDPGLRMRTSSHAQIVSDAYAFSRHPYRYSGGVYCLEPGHVRLGMVS